MKPQLYYIYDPMCSWCWGYAPTWQRLKKELAPHVDIIYGLGGLAKDCDEIMPEEMQTFLQQTWRNISQQLGTEFNYDFWQQCLPRRSTYPACRATIIARGSDKELAMLTAIQHAYYLHAKNPSDLDTLHALAVEIGLDSSDFLTQMNSAQVDNIFKKEMTTMRNLSINGFPSLVLVQNHATNTIPIDYKDWRKSYELILSKI